MHRANLLLVLQLPIYNGHTCVCITREVRDEEQEGRDNVLLFHSLICSGFVLE